VAAILESKPLELNLGVRFHLDKAVFRTNNAIIEDDGCVLFVGRNSDLPMTLGDKTSEGAFIDERGVCGVRATLL
jgi:hypothetical protein